ncbi:MAG: MerR family transcriptional regulator [Chromatiales bacterium]|nr:MerR family transcriptional regulator [Chromatiales bacterium]
MNTPANTPTQYPLDTLCTLAGLPRRTVRYYIQLKLVDPPIGATRGAYYTDRHLQQLLTIRKWTEGGLSLERISELLRGDEPGVPAPKPRKPGSVEVMSHLVVADGVELVIEPGRAGLKPEEVRKLFKSVLDSYSEITRSANNKEQGE